MNYLLKLAFVGLLFVTSANATEIDSKGAKVTYLDFWASWCAPCRQSLAWMNELQAKYGGKGLKIIAVNVEEDTEGAKQFLKSIDPTYEIQFDPEGTLPAKFDVQAMPTSFILDSTGKVVKSFEGLHGDEQKEIEEIISSSL